MSVLMQSIQSVVIRVCYDIPVWHGGCSAHRHDVSASNMVIGIPFIAGHFTFPLCAQAQVADILYTSTIE